MKAKIGTHDGQFHADEVLATTMLVNYTEKYREGEITRSRDPKIWAEQDILVDVGGVYDPSTGRYDHHQKEFQGTISEKSEIRLSSAGLIYKHFGKEIVKNVIAKILNSVQLKIEVNFDEQSIDLIYWRLYDQFIASVDAVDNGIDQFPDQSNKRYRESTTFPSRIARYNPQWSIQSKFTDLELFKQAMLEADRELVDQVSSIALGWYPARPYVLKALENRFKIHESGRICVLDVFVPWRDHLYELETQLGIEGQVLYVLFREKDTQDSAWRIQCVGIQHSFKNRKSLKKEWRGVQDLEKLRTISGIPDIIFCHAAGFIGGARSYESVLKMALISISEPNDD